MHTILEKIHHERVLQYLHYTSVSTQVISAKMHTQYLSSTVSLTLKCKSKYTSIWQSIDSERKKERNEKRIVVGWLVHFSIYLPLYLTSGVYVHVLPAICQNEYRR